MKAQLMGLATLILFIAAVVVGFGLNLSDAAKRQGFESKEVLKAATRLTFTTSQKEDLSNATKHLVLIRSEDFAKVVAELSHEGWTIRDQLGTGTFLDRQDQLLVLSTQPVTKYFRMVSYTQAEKHEPRPINESSEVSSESAN